MLKFGRIIAAVLVVGFLATLEVLAGQQQGGPPHHDFTLANRVPATIYLPGRSRSFYEQVASPVPAALRPPAVVVVHGYSGDRVLMSTLARRIAQNGYAVLTIDLHGHGQNRNPFSVGFMEPDPLHDDIKAAVDYLRASPLVDGSRIVVLGHSMGAGAALDYANYDQNLAGSVMVSGGWWLAGPLRPHNALFIFAQRDPEFISASSIRLAGLLANASPVELGKIYGDIARGDAVEAVRVPGVDHVQIINSREATRTMIQWLDAVNGVKRATPINLREPRGTTAAIASVLFLVLLIPIGRITASLTSVWPQREAGKEVLTGFAVLAVALAAALPLMAIAPPASFISVEVANEVVSWLTLAGLLMIVWLVFERPVEFRKAGSKLGAALPAAGLAMALIYATEAAASSATFHDLVLTPERLVASAVSTILLMPFFLSFELLVRRGSVTKSVLLGLSGRLIIVLLLAAGLLTGAMPFVVGLMIGLFVMVFVAFEIFAAAVYSISGNLWLIGMVQSAWLAWILAALMPITISF